MRRYAFTRNFAVGLEVIGALCIVAGVALGILLFIVGAGNWVAAVQPLSPAERVLAHTVVSVTPAVWGLVIGAPLIVYGQMILLAIDHRIVAGRHLRVTRAMLRLMRGTPRSDERSPLAKREPRST